MRFALALLIALSLVACGGSTAPSATRYNFAVIDGKNQVSTAGDPTLSKPVTSQLTQAPDGKFALGTRVLDFLLPAKAFAQSAITLKGNPVANTLVCGRIAAAGEPQIVPICAYTASDGKVPSTVLGGTKAGSFTLVYTAQAPSQDVIADSTTVVVKAAAIVTNFYAASNGPFDNFNTSGQSPFTADNDPKNSFVRDKYGNAVPYKLVPSAFAHALSDSIGTVSARTLVADSSGTGSVTVVTESGQIGKGKVIVNSKSITIGFGYGY